MDRSPSLCAPMIEDRDLQRPNGKATAMALLKQVSVFLENVPGRLATLCNTLESNGVNIRAMATSEGTEYGVVRLIVDDFETATQALRTASLPFSTVDVLGIEVSDEPGALGQVALNLAEAGINVEYAYATAASSAGKALCVVKVPNPQEAQQVLDE